MNYIALARKWRPSTFSELIGQDHLKKVLVNSLEQKRLHHAYLFTGTRGVGKTSVARLFAKALNCEKGISANPCLQCSNCLAIAQGNFIDLIEVDAASRTRVEDTRELLENIQYIPSIGKYKIYLIDEVHMLSNHSCNALLKTLEEPPEHVKFFLATTDPQKLPITILSRCLQFHLKPVNVETLTLHIQKILQDENIQFTLPAVQMIAKAARGSVRDALSILDQAIAACSNNTLSIDDVKNLLGYTQQDYALQLLQALSASNVHALLQISKQIAVEGAQYPYVFEALLQYLHQISIYQLAPNYEEFQSNSSEILSLAQQMTPEDVQLFYQIAIKGYEEMHLAPTPAIAFEMTLLRMCAFQPAKNVPILATTPPLKTPLESTLHTTPESKLPQNSLDKNKTQLDWTNIIKQLNLSGLTLTAAEHACLISKNEQVITLQIDNGHSSLFTSNIVKRLEKALSDFYHEKIKLYIETTQATITTPAEQKRILNQQNHQSAEDSILADPFVQTLTQEFSAEVIKNSILPNKNSQQLELEDKK